MFASKNIFSSFSVDDLDTAKDFYSRVLEINVKEDEMGFLTLNYKENEPVIIYPKPDHQPATFTILNFVVADLEKTVNELNRRGVKFEHYKNELKTDEKGIFRGEKGPYIAWFKDPAGNILSVLEE